jgi:hypothetical protein
MVESLHHVRGPVQRKKSIDLIPIGKDARLHYLRTKDVNGTADEQVRSVTQELRNTTNEEFRRIAGSLDSQIKQLDDAMTKELERALSAMVLAPE